jgi:hypothetical protein
LFQLANLETMVEYPVSLMLGKEPDRVAKLLSSEQAGHAESAMRHIARQTWYGIGNDAKGFVGLIAQMITGATHEVDATGSSAKSSIFFARLGTNTLQHWYGHNRTLTFDDFYRQTVTASGGGSMEAEVSWMHCHVGVRLQQRNALVRIKNIGTANGTTATYAHMHAALRKFRDLGQEPTHIFMNSRTLEQLRLTLVTALVPEPSVPKEFEGIPIVLTNALSENESI